MKDVFTARHKCSGSRRNFAVVFGHRASCPVHINQRSTLAPILVSLLRCTFGLIQSTDGLWLMPLLCRCLLRRHAHNGILDAGCGLVVPNMAGVFTGEGLVLADGNIMNYDASMSPLPHNPHHKCPSFPWSFCTYISENVEIRLVVAETTLQSSSAYVVVSVSAAATG